MPSSPKKTFYWDACVLLAYFLDEPGRAAEADALLRDAKEGKIEIITSMVSITEAAYGPGTVNKAIDTFWQPPSPVKLVEIHRRIASHARDLIRRSIEEGRKLTPLDAIHVATAFAHEVDEFHSYDKRPRDWAADLGIKSDEPNSGRLALEPPPVSERLEPKRLAESPKLLES